MEWSGYLRPRVAARTVYRLASILAAFCTVALAGCNTDGQPSASIATPQGATVAFESIDGPPAGIFHKLVDDLNDEAQARRMAVVSRESPSIYRVRGYLSAHVRQDETSIAWVWDVYDPDQHRALRISGVEKAAGKHRTWAAADDKILRDIARSSIEQLAAFLQAPENAPAAREPTMTVANLGGGMTPESAGIFRISQPNADPVANAGETDAATDDVAAVPLPPRRPQIVAGTVSGREMLVLASSRH